MSEEYASVMLLLGGFLAVILVIGFVWYVLRVIGYWRIFTKAGVPGWKSIIPIYNIYVQYQLTWKGVMVAPLFILACAGPLLSQQQNWILSLLGGLCSLASAIINIIGLHRLSKSFGHGAGFTVGLFFFEPIFAMILGFGESQYLGNPSDEGLDTRSE